MKTLHSADATSTFKTTIPAVDLTKIVPLVTGGGSGIGLGIVKEFMKRGSPKVLITGRTEATLKNAVEECNNVFGVSKVFYKVSDAGDETDREELLEWIRNKHPDCNALINNAAIHRRVEPCKDHATWKTREEELRINLHGPIHLTTLFVPHFLSKVNELCIIANVTSGLAFIPFAASPVYACTKAAMHSYTMSMRYNLQNTNLKILEIVPPRVKTNIMGHFSQTGFGDTIEEYCNDVMNHVEAGDFEFGYKLSETARLADRPTLDEMMKQQAKWMKVVTYPPTTAS